MGYFVYALSRWTARFGALVMLALAFLSVLSIAGRSLSAFGLGPIPGDFELVETGTALAVFCSLPWCFLVRGHAVVDLFWERFPTSAQRAVESVSTILMLLVWLLLTWRMGIAMLEHRASNEVGFILQMPIWWGYAASLLPAVIGCVAYAWRFLETIDMVKATSLAQAQLAGH